MQPLKVLILNGPGYRTLIRTSPFLGQPGGELLEWEMVTNDDSRNYLQIRTFGRPADRAGNPYKVYGRIIGWGLPERDPKLDQGEYYKYTIVIEMQNADEQWYYYVGDYLRGSNDRFGEGVIYTAEEYAKISTTCPREAPPERIYQGEDLSIITSAKQPMCVI